MINDFFTEQCIIDLSFVEKSFVQEYRLQLDPLKPGEFRVFIAAGESKIKAIGTVKLTLTFFGEEFPFEFQVVDRLSTNILLGINFILHYPCVRNMRTVKFSHLEMLTCQYLWLLKEIVWVWLN